MIAKRKGVAARRGLNRQGQAGVRREGQGKGHEEGHTEASS